MRRLEPASLVLALLCAGWTLAAVLLDWNYRQAGAILRPLLWDGEYWRLVTAMLVHDMSNWVHLALNAVSLYLLGSAVVVLTNGRRAAMVLCVLFSAWAGFALSLAFEERDVWHVGISGGVFGLLGALLAIEWAHARGWAAFKASRNTRLVLFFLLLNAGIAVWVHYSFPAMRLDHLAHVGGFVFGLTAGLAYYGQLGRIRRGAGIAVVLLLSVLPTAYVCWPALDRGFHLHRARRAHRAGDAEAAAAAYRAVLRLDPEHLPAGTYLAVHEDDPSHLSGLRAPATAAEAHAVLRAYLTLARRRLAAPEPEAAAALVARARTLPPTRGFLWLKFARDAAQAGRDDLAETAAERAADLFDESESLSSWRHAADLLGVHQRRVARTLADGTAPDPLAVYRRAARAGFQAAGGLAELEDAELQGLRQTLTVHAALVDQAVQRIWRKGDQDPARFRELAAALRDLYRVLANNTDDEKHALLFLARRAFWAFQALASPPEKDPAFADVRAIWAATWRQARAAGNQALEAEAATWFRRQKLDPPEDLGEPPGGG